MLHPGNLIYWTWQAGREGGRVEIFQYNLRKDNGRNQFGILRKICIITLLMAWIFFMLKRELFLIVICDDECLMSEADSLIFL